MRFHTASSDKWHPGRQGDQTSGTRIRRNRAIEARAHQTPICAEAQSGSVRLRHRVREASEIEAHDVIRSLSMVALELEAVAQVHGTAGKSPVSRAVTVTSVPEASIANGATSVSVGLPAPGCSEYVLGGRLSLRRVPQPRRAFMRSLQARRQRVHLVGSNLQDGGGPLIVLHGSRSSFRSTKAQLLLRCSCL